MQKLSSASGNPVFHIRKIVPDCSKFLAYPTDHMQFVSSNNVLTTVNLCIHLLHQIPVYMIAVWTLYDQLTNGCLYTPSNNKSTLSTGQQPSLSSKSFTCLCCNLLHYFILCIAIIIFYKGKWTIAYQFISSQVVYHIHTLPHSPSSLYFSFLMILGLDLVAIM